MRITFVSTMGGAPWGGSEELWSRAALRCKDQGHDVSASIVDRPRQAPQVAAMQAAGIHFFIRQPLRISFASRTWQRVTRRFRPPLPAEFAWLMAQRPELTVISQGANHDGLGWMTFCRERKLPYVAIMHCNTEGWWPNDVTGAELAEGYRGARKVFCVSRHNLELLEWQLGESLPNAAVIWNPVNVPAGPPPAWPIADGLFKLASVGRLDPAAKGQDLLFKVLARPHWRERPVELNLYGAGPCEHSLRRSAARLNLANVHFRGHVSEVRTIWEQNHLLALPSRYEGLPLVLVEAMWCARPAVVTDIGGNAEMCVEGETGFVASAPTADLLDAAMERAWNQRANWPAIGLAGRARAEKLVPADAVGDFCQKLKQCLDR